jgi:hypothetical protein
LAADLVDLAMAVAVGSLTVAVNGGVIRRERGIEPGLFGVAHQASSSDKANYP